MLACLLAGCRTPQHAMRTKLEAIVIPEIDFRQTNVANVIAFCVDPFLKYEPTRLYPRVRFSSIPSTEEHKHEREVHEKRFRKLNDFCKGKSITLNLTDCSLADLLDFITSYAGVEYRFVDK